jgi:hypothetical protein
MNVPYVIDNIWEWLRPKNMPSRRHSVFAAPTREAAIRSVIGNDTDAPVFEPTQVAQIFDVDDARDHPDVKKLQRELQRMLSAAGWFDEQAERRGTESQLFTPCLSQDELQVVFGASERLAACRT